MRADAEEGCVERTCVSCEDKVMMLDSADSLEDAQLTSLRCRPGHVEFNLAVGFAYRDGGEVRWVYIGTRCVADGILGAVAEWEAPSHGGLAALRHPPLPRRVWMI